MVLRNACILALATWGILTGGSSHAGAGSSGGGLVLKDAHNPWFLENTQEVRYCIAHDTNAFSLPLEQVRHEITRALSFWKDQLQRGAYTKHWDLNPPRALTLGTQTFVESSCDERTSLIFQLGSLTPQQKEMIHSIPSTIAEVVRTDYDRVNLRGSGFVYVAPDRGPLWDEVKVVGENTWASVEGKTFYFTILHELGHIFGLPDTSGEPLLMRYGFVQSMVNDLPQLGSEFAKLLKEPDVTEWTQSMLDMGWVSCIAGGVVGSHEKWRERVLGIPAVDKRCEQIRLLGDTLEIYAGPRDDQLSLVGSATLTFGPREHGQTLVSVWLPPEQKVFGMSPPEQTNGISRPAIFSSVATITRLGEGTYRVHATGFETPFVTELDPQNSAIMPTLIGIVDGKPISNLIYPRLKNKQMMATTPDKKEHDSREIFLRKLGLSVRAAPRSPAKM